MNIEQGSKLKRLRFSLVWSYIAGSLMGVYLTHIVIIPLLLELQSSGGAIFMPLEVFYIYPFILAGAVTLIVYNANKQSILKNT